MDVFDVFTRHYDVDPDDLWVALERAVHTIEGATIDAADREAGQVVFTTHMSLTSFGQHLSAIVEQSSRGGSLLRVQGVPKGGFLSTHWGEEEHAENIERELLSGIDEALEQPE